MSVTYVHCIAQYSLTIDLCFSNSREYLSLTQTIAFVEPRRGAHDLFGDGKHRPNEPPSSLKGRISTQLT